MDPSTNPLIISDRTLNSMTLMPIWFIHIKNSLIRIIKLHKVRMITMLMMTWEWRKIDLIKRKTKSLLFSFVLINSKNLTWLRNIVKRKWLGNYPLSAVKCTTIVKILKQFGLRSRMHLYTFWPLPSIRKRSEV